MSEEPNLLDDPVALRRHLIASALRFAMVGVVMVGIAITYGRIAQPAWIGIPLALGGMVGFFYGPKWIGKNWRSEKPEDEKR